MSTKKKAFLIASIVFVLCAFGLFVFGYYLSGYDIIGWFTSRYAVYVYILVAIYAIVAVSLLVLDAVNKDF